MRNRTSNDLKNALLDEIESLRDGTSDYNRATAVAKLAMSVIAVQKTEMEAQRLSLEMSERKPGFQKMERIGVPSLVLGGNTVEVEVE